MHDKNDHLSRHFLFVSALWVALITAILCAIWPAGLPLTKTVGSAFNPSTTAVALIGRAEQVRAGAKRIVEGDPEPATDLTLPPSHQVFDTPNVPTAAPPQVRKQGSPSAPRSSAQPLPTAVTGQPYPRGPPVA